MVTAGIDIGYQSINTVILEGAEIVTHASFNIAGEVKAVAEIAFKRVLHQAELKKGDIDRIFSTGIGREKVSFADGHRTEMLCHVKGAHRIFPGAGTIIDLGAEGSRILRSDSDGNLVDFVMNDKCASGAGIFLTTVAEMMQIPLAKMGPISLGATKQLKLTTTCAVFAESEIVAEVHRGASKEDILWAVHESIAAKVASAGKRFGIKDELVFTGGVALNTGVVAALAQQIGLDIQVPENPDIIGALGAAILAGG
ncbi:acyl-CoA dehydratase activase [Thermodesulfobacteriota bacterium]